MLPNALRCKLIRWLTGSTRQSTTPPHLITNRVNFISTPFRVTSDRDIHDLRPSEPSTVMAANVASKAATIDLASSEPAGSHRKERQPPGK